MTRKPISSPSQATDQTSDNRKHCPISVLSMSYQIEFDRTVTTLCTPTTLIVPEKLCPICPIKALGYAVYFRPNSNLKHKLYMRNSELIGLIGHNLIGTN